MKIVFILATALLLESYGCDTPQQPAAVSVAKDVPAMQSCSVQHRFEKTEVYPMNLRADIALDSCTGALCKTWNWQARGTNTPWSTYNDLPECSTLPTTVAVAK